MKKFVKTSVTPKHMFSWWKCMFKHVEPFPQFPPYFRYKVWYFYFKFLGVCKVWTSESFHFRNFRNFHFWGNLKKTLKNFYFLEKQICGSPKIFKHSVVEDGLKHFDVEFLVSLFLPQGFFQVFPGRFPRESKSFTFLPWFGIFSRGLGGFVLWTLSVFRVWGGWHFIWIGVGKVRDFCFFPGRVS